MLLTMRFQLFLLASDEVVWRSVLLASDEVVWRLFLLASDEVVRLCDGFNHSPFGVMHPKLFDYVVFAFSPGNTLVFV